MKAFRTAKGNDNGGKTNLNENGNWNENGNQNGDKTVKDRN